MGVVPAPTFTYVIKQRAAVVSLWAAPGQAWWFGLL